MSSRIPLPYPRKVLELFKNPKNLGRMEDANASAVAGSLACGDMIAIYLKIDEGKNIVEKASFESYGCAANIAAASIMTEMIKGKRLRDAWNISWKEITEALGGLPSVKYHCGVLAVGALRRAIRAYFKDKNLPKWLPEELTHEEKHALEEEKLMELLYRKNDSGKV
ncbi:MAG: iron-sulfur cluster assembly scaffold protein [archaeon GB-1845-036]|nr:iron-sulfur cluster assembly scaffold protein [Candidatus Culexmicrobium thermophilum]RLE57518.1 MAG: iron-sulfur cluster assembly scaffold protein [Candidatus Verstraetearchaeota archaeon]